MKIEVETENLKQVKEVVDLNVDTIMLDNMNITDIKKAVKIIDKRSIM